MDNTKCIALKVELNKQPPREAMVPIGRFFDGNDDLGSIGCNLTEHPGIQAFRELLIGLERRPDVEAVYARIAEVDPGEESWPFTDTIFVVGKISADELRETLNSLQPDEIGPGDEFGIPLAIKQKYQAPVLAVWWD